LHLAIFTFHYLFKIPLNYEQIHMDAKVVSSGQKQIPEITDGLPNICGFDDQVIEAANSSKAVFKPATNISLDKIQSAFVIALHMHQPTIPAGGGELSTAALIGNLQDMFNHPHIGDNHNAPVFAWCYSRMADFTRELVDHTKNPRVMLDYSGTLLWGLRQMGKGDILENLKTITCDDRYSPLVEWLGTMWGHAVVSSTPVPDFTLHMRAWQHHFAAIFGLKALRRVKGFSPPEMHLPNHPDVCYEYIKSLKECGYKWLLVQEHTVENLDGSSLSRQHLPHKLVVRNSRGENISITALIKTQGADTKLVAQMQPFYEAKGLSRVDFNGVTIPPLVTQIGDGENGGVMMNEFPDGFKNAFDQIGREGTVSMNGTEYLELIEAVGCAPDKYIPIQPIHQHLLWERMEGRGERDVNQVIDEIKKENHNFHMDGGSWTNNLSWIKGYEDVLNPMSKLSTLFHEKLDNPLINKNSYNYRNALLHLLISQTSCFRYWGQGGWTDYAREICRRGTEIISKNFQSLSNLGASF